MSLSIGIVGLPNVGKSTLFNALTQKGIETANYPFCTIDPSVGVVTVPDARLDALSKFSNTQKTVPAIVEFVDIAGLVAGASEGQGLGNKFLSNIRETDAIAEVVRIFEDSEIIHVDGKIDPVHDVEVINMELMLADLQTVNNRMTNLARDVKRGDKAAIKESAVLERIKTAMEAEQLANTVVLTDEEEIKMVKMINLLTRKPFLYILNKKAGGKNLDEMNDPRFEKLTKHIEAQGNKWVVVDARITEELSAFEGEERAMFAAEMGQSTDGVDDLIRAGYDLLGLETYFTTGEKETRAWTIKKGSTAPKAGAAIHGDFETKFIRAQVINWKDLIDSGSFGSAREKGQLRTEGREYIVKDGDVMEFMV
jgi:GTP-binding protein YchF